MKSPSPTLSVVLTGLLSLACATGRTVESPATTTDSAMAPAEALFTRYLELSSAFDPAIAELYADDAVVHGSRKLADGSTRKVELPGAQWKRAVPQMMALAKQRGDVSTHTQVRYKKLEDGFEVRTHRRSALKCHVDEQHRMLLKPDAQGALKIVEEHVLTQSLSSCPDQDPAPLMEQQVSALAPRLPAQVDEETRLDSLRIDGKALVYRFTLVNVADDEFDEARFRALVWEMLVAQSCLAPTLRPILDNGAQVAYDYRAKTGEPLLRLSVGEHDCP